MSYDWITAVGLLVGVPILVAYAYALYVNTYWRRKGVPYAEAAPFVGNLASLLTARRCAAEHYEEMYALAKEKMTPVLGMHLFMKPALLITDRELIKRVLVKDFSSFNNRHSSSDIHTDCLGTTNLFFVKNPAWRTIRLRLTPFFTAGKMRQMFGLMDDIGTELNRTLLTIEEPKKRQNVEVKDLLARFTTDIIASCAFGVNANSLKNPDSDFRRQGRKMFDYTVKRAIEFTSLFFLPEVVGFFRFKTFSAKTNDFLRDSIELVMDERQKSGTKRNDLIDTLVTLRTEDQDKVYSPSNIVFKGDVLVAQAASFFTAGFETSAAVMAFGLFELCRRPDIQDRLRQEIKTTFEANGGQLTYEAVLGMEYLGMVMSETLRMYPPLPFLDRECTATEYSLSPHSHFVIPKGMPVVIPVYALHRDPELYENPLHFDPERFSAKNRDQIPPYAYMPFGTGPHNCIGDRFGLITSRLGMINMFRNHRVVPSDRTPERLQLDPKALLMTAKGGVFLNIIPDALC